MPAVLGMPAVPPVQKATSPAKASAHGIDISRVIVVTYVVWRRSCGWRCLGSPLGFLSLYLYHAQDPDDYRI